MFIANYGGKVTTIEKLEREIKTLTRSESTAFRKWFIQYDSDEWDRQIEDDIRADKLDKLAQEALAAYKTGKTNEL